MSVILKQNKYHSILIVFFILLAVCSGCNRNIKEENSVKIADYPNSVSIEESQSKSFPLDASSGFDFGKVIPQKYEGKMENNLLSQMNAYKEALMIGDFDNCIRFMYPPVIPYYRKYYGNLADEQISREFYKQMSEQQLNTIKSLREKGIEMEIVVPKLDKKIIYQSTIFIRFTTIANLEFKDVKLHGSEGEPTLAISENNGVNWWFVAINDETPNYLSKDFPQEVINAIMGY